MSHKGCCVLMMLKNIVQRESTCDSVIVNEKCQSSLDLESLWKHTSPWAYDRVPRNIHLRTEDPCWWGWHYPMTSLLPDSGHDWQASLTSAALSLTIMDCDLKRWAKYTFLSVCCFCQIICQNSKGNGWHNLILVGVTNSEHFVKICNMSLERQAACCRRLTHPYLGDMNRISQNYERPTLTWECWNVDS